MRKLILGLVTTILLLGGCQAPDLFDMTEIRQDAVALELNRDALESMITGETRRLVASFVPAEVADRTLVWESGNETVATVENGVVRAVGLGKTEITASSPVYDGIKAVCTVNVDKESGISITDLATGDIVEDELMFFKNETYEFSYFIKVFNSFDERVSVSVESEEIDDVENFVTVEQKVFGEDPGFAVTVKQTEGTGKIVVTSVSQEDLVHDLPFKVVSPHVADISLAYMDEDSDGNRKIVSGQETEATLTIGRTGEISIAFETDIDGVEYPENPSVRVSSDNANVILGEPQYNPDRTIVFSAQAMETAAEGEIAGITVVSQDNPEAMAVIRLTLDKPAVLSLVLNRELSDPVHAGDTVQLSVTTLPSDAYDQNVVWESEDRTVAEVAATQKNPQKSIVSVKPDFVFDPENPEATEKLIFVSSAGNPAVKAQCKLRPYQYVPVEGIMITDQWGNRISGTAYSGTKEGDTYVECSAQYCSGGNKATKTAPFNYPAGEWGEAEPSFPDAQKCGSRQVWLTASVWPYTYPKIADPDTEFCWSGSIQNRFAIPAAGNEDGNVTGTTGKECTTYNGNDGKYAFSDVQIGKTVLFWTGNGGGDSPMTRISLYEYDPNTAYDATAAKKLLFKFYIHVCDNARKADYRSNWLMNIPGTTNKGRLFRLYRPQTPGWLGSTDKTDKVPWPWTGPDVKPSKGPEPYTQNYKTQVLSDRPNITEGNPDLK